MLIFLLLLKSCLKQCTEHEIHVVRVNGDSLSVLLRTLRAGNFKPRVEARDYWNGVSKRGSSLRLESRVSLSQFSILCVVFTPSLQLQVLLILISVSSRSQARSRRPSTYGGGYRRFKKKMMAN